MTPAFAIVMTGLLAAQAVAPTLAQTSSASHPALRTQTGSAAARPATGDTTTTPPAPAPTTGASPAAHDYRLSAGDKLRVEVYRDQQLSQSVQIRPDGKITLPLLGDVQAAGLTPIALRDRLTTSLKEYITTPVVTVIVVEATPATVFVMGEVKAPGPQPLRGSMTVLEALAMAGGFLDFAKTSDIRVLRKAPAGTETLKFNYKKALKGEGEPIVLRAGDIVVVP
ncbi:MAG: polysaccharide biosynthesis/export family protein [Acidobacteria bacterium]|nr:polysaccharide biosynthesis/export family protein [Acidobacteriota bacterium]